MDGAYEAMDPTDRRLVVAAKGPDAVAPIQCVAAELRAAI
jgi:hypothetical protein